MMLPSNNILIVRCVGVGVCMSGCLLVCVCVSDICSKVLLRALKVRVQTAAKFKSSLLSCRSCCFKKTHISLPRLQGTVQPKMKVQSMSVLTPMSMERQMGEVFCQAPSRQLSERNSNFLLAECHFCQKACIIDSHISCKAKWVVSRACT